MLVALLVCEIHLLHFFRARKMAWRRRKSLLPKGNNGEPDVNFRAAHVNFGEMICVSVVSGQQSVGSRKSRRIEEPKGACGASHISIEKRRENRALKMARFAKLR